jgi:secreted trypsin-like serine protease
MARWRILLGTAVAAVTALTTVTGASPAVAAPPGPGDGAVGPQVVGGTRAAEGEFPFMVYVSTRSFSCDGALYSPTLVLTAGHCVNGSGTRNDTGFTITMGTVDRQSSSAITRRSNKTYRPSGWNSQTLANDWALIHLTSPVTTIAPLPITTTSAYDNGTFTIAGWGTTSETGGTSRYLLKATVPFVDDTTCNDSSHYNGQIIPAQMICAGYEQGGVDTCQGDSGGPMFRPDANNAWVEVGIVSWGEGCAEAHRPGVYTQVSNFATAIRSAASSLGG